MFLSHPAEQSPRRPPRPSIRAVTFLVRSAFPRQKKQQNDMLRQMIEYCAALASPAPASLAAPCVFCTSALPRYTTSASATGRKHFTRIHVSAAEGCAGEQGFVSSQPFKKRLAAAQLRGCAILSILLFAVKSSACGGSPLRLCKTDAVVVDPTSIWFSAVFTTPGLHQRPGADHWPAVVALTRNCARNAVSSVGKRDALKTTGAPDASTPTNNSLPSAQVAGASAPHQPLLQAYRKAAFSDDENCSAKSPNVLNAARHDSSQHCHPLRKRLIRRLFAVKHSASLQSS